MRNRVESRFVTSRLDWAIVAFFAIAYGLAWGIWLLTIPLAASAGMEPRTSSEQSMTVTSPPLRATYRTGCSIS